MLNYETQKLKDQEEVDALRKLRRDEHVEILDEVLDGERFFPMDEALARQEGFEDAVDAIRRLQDTLWAYLETEGVKSHIGRHNTRVIQEAMLVLQKLDDIPDERNVLWLHE